MISDTDNFIFLSPTAKPGVDARHAGSTNLRPPTLGLQKLKAAKVNATLLCQERRKRLQSRMTSRSQAAGKLDGGS